MRQKIASITQMLRLPSVCVLCDQYHYQPIAVCNQCTHLLERLGPACHYCAFPLPDDIVLICGNCAKEKPAFDHTYTAYLFKEPLRTLLHEFKYHEAFYLTSFLAKLMLQAVPKGKLETQCLIPVPLHPKRLKQRGFNQAVLLCKNLAKALKIPYELSLCKKIIHTEPQVCLNREQRKQNLTAAFQSRQTHYQHITLIDDLLTTGSTAQELANLFKAQGVKRVDVWCCARAI